MTTNYSLRMVEGDDGALSKKRMESRLARLVAHIAGDFEDSLGAMVLKTESSGAAYVYAYSDNDHGLRIHLSPSTVRALIEERRPEKWAMQKLHCALRDLAANLKSRKGKSKDYFRRATISLNEVPDKRGRRRSSEQPQRRRSSSSQRRRRTG